ncbi:MMPL family transporter, partial [Mycolicibacterium sp.]|uniref:MMPL family transporter n=1 Tax=Mycolicibacterium sp. TaxID=2320850 RepID=UPI0028B04095
MHRAPEPRRSFWDRFGELVAGRLSWVLALVMTLAGGALLGLVPDNGSAEQAPVVIPASAESAQVTELLKQFPGGDQAPVILLITRSDSQPLSPADLAAAQQAKDRTVAAAGAPAPPIPMAPSEDGEAALSPVLLQADLNGFALTDKVTELRDAARDDLPAPLVANITGGPAFGADIANSFSGANFVLLAVTVGVVALLLIITYRSPVLWLVPLLVIAFADRVAAVAGTAVAEATGFGGDGSSSGITSVLVFGAGTNYALLLISRYREELRRAVEHRAALSTAVRFAGPAIAASNATVVLALLSLLLAKSPTTRSLGVQAAAGLLVAALFVLLVLPPLLALFGRKLFWPFIPQPDGQE